MRLYHFQGAPRISTRSPRWPLYLGLAVLSLACCYLAICGATGFFLGRAGSETPGYELSGTHQDPTPAQPPVQRPPLPLEAQTARVLEGATLPSRDLAELAQRLQGQPLPRSTPTIPDPPPYALGDRETFWLHDMGNNAYFTATAILRFETPHAYWWVAEGHDVDEQHLARSAHNFENQTYPLNHRFFGSEPNPGIDGDPHIYLFLGDVPGVAGYFSGPDEYPADIRPHSNQHEMIYLDLGNAPPGGDYFDGVLAHEFQHMIHWAVDRDEATWVNEGLSELAASLNGYDVGGAEQVFARVPDTQLTTWPDLGDSGPSYGASYLFLNYFFEQYGAEAIQQLVAEPANGIAGFEAVLADVDPDRTFEDVFADWLAANYLDGHGSDEGPYSYAGIELDALRTSARHDSYPLEQRADVHQYAADYVVLEGDGDLEIEFIGSTAVSLVGNRTHDGDYQWCAVRGDEGDATLTRALDLTGMAEASLSAWLWYDLEADYDYAYVEVSDDGGQTWHILAGDLASTDNPSGNSYGPAYTGISGRSDSPEWVHETFDLSPFAGGPLLLRFEVITDDSINHPGLCLDDVSLPALGFEDGAEEDDAGWQAAGWVRVGDHVPQQFLVQVITLGDSVGVQRLALDEQNRGRLTLSGLGTDLDRAVLVISALAPSTTEPAVYSYSISQP
ncbi:MAG: immune inhibitor A [Anaerolineae bacterium]